MIIYSLSPQKAGTKGKEERIKKDIDKIKET